MTRPVTLSEEAFAAIRGAKRGEESTSDVVLRLIREARSATRDPARILRLRLERAVSARQHRSDVRESRRLDRRDPWKK